MGPLIFTLSLIASCTMPFFACPENKKDAITCYYNGRVVKDHQLKSEELWVSQGKIIDPQQKADAYVDVKGAIIAPGYIDIQINGAFGHDFTSEPQGVADVARQLPRYGVTAFLPTMVSSSKETYHEATLKLLSESTQPLSAAVLGLHLEGPFFCPEKRGAHDPNVLQNFEQVKDIESFYGNLEGVKIVTLAPELPGALNIIKTLTNRGIIVSAGHSNASYEEMQAAKDSGVQLATHLFNAMPPFHHRAPGMIGVILTQADLFYSVIADHLHVHPVAIHLSWKANPQGLILVTDAMAALGLADGTYFLGDQSITLKDGVATVSGTQTLAGSTIGMDVAVRNFRLATQCSIVDAIEAATSKPAKLLGITHKGTLTPGADADFILLNDDLEILSSYLLGQIWYE